MTDDTPVAASLTAAAVERETAELETLAVHARAEQGRFEQKRVVAEARYVQLRAGAEGVIPPGLIEAIDALLIATKRTELMNGQVDALEAKLRSLVRLSTALHAAAGETAAERLDASAVATAGMSDLLAAEDLRRVIVRRIHDGTAQTLTNVILQAQIVERALGRDPERARAEVAGLVEMTRRSLDDIRTFIFDIRPMILDDLGLVPTLRHIVREYGDRANIDADFAMSGREQRLESRLESGLFRLVDDVLRQAEPGTLAGMRVKLEWSAGHLRLLVTLVPQGSPLRDMVAESFDHLPAAMQSMIAESQRPAAAPPLFGPEVHERLQMIAGAIGASVTISEEHHLLQLDLPLATTV